MKGRLGFMMVMGEVSSTTTYWMREGAEKVVVCASARGGPGADGRRARTMEERAARVAELAGSSPRSRGSMVRSDGRGGVTVTGMAELPWDPQVVEALEKLGLAEVK